MYADIYLVGGFNLSEKYESQSGWWFPIYGKIKNVPNHQPDKDDLTLKLGSVTIKNGDLTIKTLRHGYLTINNSELTVNIVI